MERVDLAVIGAGAVGLAVAARLAGPERSVVVCERHDRFGQETSSRNSEVIHAGIYYPPGSLKARLCAAGNPLVYAFCREHGVRHQRLGKLIIATEPSEIPALKKLLQNGEANGVAGLAWLEAGEARALEPAVRCLAALHSPDTGIFDTHGFMAALCRQAEARGAMLLYNSEVIAVHPEAGGYLIELNRGQERFHAARVVNAAGLECARVAGLAGLDGAAAGYVLHYCKGEYFRTTQRLPVSRLVYPVPQERVHSLGIHLTRDLAGSFRFGPDAAYVDGVDYGVNENKRGIFADAVRRYLPELDPALLYPDLAGIRPKLQGPEDGFRDFVIREESGQGLPGWVNLIGIESPGLTSALAIADQVAGMV
ncbi:MAG: NAD(P)/FAD-dependent oxidoreductase [candidate division FCPU426 bacterium]